MPKSGPTQWSSASVQDYLDGIRDPHRRQDAVTLCRVMTESTGVTAAMWGTGIVGFGAHRYTHESGRTGETVAVGFAARARALVVYGLRTARNEPLLERLGVRSDAKGCIYLTDMDRIDPTALAAAVTNAYMERVTADE